MCGHDAVRVLLSSGVPQVPVPDVTGRDQDEATGVLRDAKFQVSTTQEDSETVPEGDVIRQNPRANASAAKFSTVTLTVSSGQPLVTIPTIPGSTSQDDATAQLEALGLQVRVSHPLGTPFGRVVGTNPPAGAQVRKGSRVTIFVV